MTYFGFRDLSLIALFVVAIPIAAYLAWAASKGRLARRLGESEAAEEL